MRPRDIYKYYRTPDSFYGGWVFREGATGLSCGFDSIRGNVSSLNEELARQQFSTELCKVRKITFVPTTEREELLNELLLSCPFVTHVYESNSRHGDYKVYMWVIDPKAMEGV